MTVKPCFVSLELFVDLVKPRLKLVDNSFADIVREVCFRALCRFLLAIFPFPDKIGDLFEQDNYGDNTKHCVSEIPEHRGRDTFYCLLHLITPPFVLLFFLLILTLAIADNIEEFRHHVPAEVVPLNPAPFLAGGHDDHFAAERHPADQPLLESRTDTHVHRAAGFCNDNRPGSSCGFRLRCRGRRWRGLIIAGFDQDGELSVMRPRVIWLVGLINGHLTGHVPDLERIGAVDYAGMVVVVQISVVILAALSVTGRKRPVLMSLWHGFIDDIPGFKLTLARDLLQARGLLSCRPVAAVDACPFQSHPADGADGQSDAVTVAVRSVTRFPAFRIGIEDFKHLRQELLHNFCISHPLPPSSSNADDFLFPMETSILVLSSAVSRIFSVSLLCVYRIPAMI